MLSEAEIMEIVAKKQLSRNQINPNACMSDYLEEVKEIEPIKEIKKEVKKDEPKPKKKGA